MYFHFNTDLQCYWFTNNYCFRTVKVTLGAEKDVDVRLFISYVVYNASWSPSYDLRVFTKDKSMKVAYTDFDV